jgi:TetR/AcrR family transcriptional repressor of nem operon
MAGRPRQFDPAHAVAQAMDLFWARGYAATSVDDLVDRLGVQRGSLYAAFTDKRTLYITALRAYGDAVGALLRPILDAPASPRQNLLNMLDFWLDRTTASRERRGCMLVNTITEVGRHDPEIDAAARDILARLEKLLERAVDRAIDAGELPPDRPPRQVARALVATIMGLLVLSKAGAAPAVLRDVIESAKGGLR